MQAIFFCGCSCAAKAGAAMAPRAAIAMALDRRPVVISRSIIGLQAGHDVGGEHCALDHHAGYVEGTFEYIALGGLGHRAVAVEIAIPFTIFSIGRCL